MEQQIDSISKSEEQEENVRDTEVTIPSPVII